ncbi:MAG: PKD domain-containing protein [Bacteroidales bacterium]|nr:PKD domain-containing protein [Bacteroidales bacterium]
MRSTKLLTIFMLSFLISFSDLFSQCSLIIKSGSAQDPQTVCAPVNFTMSVWYKFLIPVNPAQVEILFVWNDGSVSTTTVPGNWNTGNDSVWAEATHLYPPTNECSSTADAYIVFDGEICTSSSHQEQTFSTWGTDEENSGVLSTDPIVAYFCEGEDIINVTFDDNSTFNCNILIEPDNPNRYYRWVQFIYNTYSSGGDRIPDVTVRDGSGIIHNMTDNNGNFISSLDGPIIQIPIPADGPNQTSFEISAPAGAVAGDIFEITLRNWNVCNPYDDLPTDGIPPADLINGDNPPITTTARIEVIAPPPIVVSNLFEFCTTENVILHATAGGAEVRWYSDVALTNLLFAGTDYNPQLPPFNLDNTIPGNYTFYVTSYQGICESGPNQVDVVIYQSPENVYAGLDQIICADSVRLNASVPSAGSGIWSTTGSSIIENNTQRNTRVRNLEHGDNEFIWTVTNGSCAASDVVHIISDRQPSNAYAGTDDSICNATSISLNATPPDVSGSGMWIITQGSGTPADPNSPNTNLNNPSAGNNQLIWRVSSLYGACPVTRDTVNYFVDFPAGTADAGNDFHLCETSSISLNGNAPINGGSGIWVVETGASIIVNPNNPTSLVNNIDEGLNSYIWTLNSLYGLCPESADTVNIIRDLTPGTADAGSDISLCLENSDTLQGNTPLRGTGNWNVVADPSGINPVFFPNIYDPNAIITVLPGNEGQYILQWVLQNGVCENRDTMIIDFGIPPPPGFAGNDTVVCGLEIDLQSNTFAQGQGLWTQISGTGVATFSPDRYSDNPHVIIPEDEEGIYEFEWMLTSGACAPSSDTVEITFLRLPDEPTVAGVSSCGPDSMLLSATNLQSDVIIRWYSDSTIPSPFNTGETFQTPYLLNSAYYYTSSYDTVSGCESDRVEAGAEIFNIPGSPSLISDTLCGAGNALLTGLISPPANTIIWYEDSPGITMIETGTVFNPAVTDDTIFYARAADTIHSCLSEIDSIEVIVHPEIPVPVVINDSSCGPSDFILSAIGSSTDHWMRWYETAIDNTIIHIDDTMFVPLTDTSRHFWVSEWNDSTVCASPRIECSAIVQPMPSAPMVNDTSSCGAASFTIRPQGNSITDAFRWYDLPVNGSMIVESDSFNTGFLSSNFSVWVSGYNTETSCESSRNQVDISVFPMPTTLVINGPTVVLVDQSGVIFSTSGSSASTYIWNIPPEITLDVNMNDFVRLSFPNTGSFDISAYEITSNGCIGNPVTHPITVINDSILLNISPYNQSACTGVDFEIRPYLFGGTPPFTYTWTGDIIYLSSTSSLFTTFSPPGTGIYNLYLEVMDINLKTTKDSVKITVFESPTADITTEDEIVCVGDNLQLLVEITGYEAASHNWTGPIHNLSSYTVQEPVYTPQQPDTVQYFYELTDINGCKAYDSVNIYSDIPLAYFEIQTEPGCSPLDVEFNNQSLRAVSYEWDFGDESYSDLANPSHLYINQSPEIKYFPVSLEVTSMLGCKDQMTQYAMVWPNPVATLDAIPENACSPALITLFSTPGNRYYYWDLDDGTTQTTNEFSIIHTFETQEPEDETFIVKVITESSLHCIDSAFLPINIYATPNADFSISPPANTFPDNSFYIDNLTIGNEWNYDWEFGNGNVSTIPEPGEITYESSGNYTITLTVSDEQCTDSISRTVYLYPAMPEAKFEEPEPGCMPHTISFINSSEYADEYLWEFGDGSISTAANPSYTYYEAGIYRVKLTVRGAGGESSYCDTARVYILPNAFFELAPRYVYVNDEPVHFFNLSDNADIIEWNFGDGTTSNEFNTQHIYREEGTYEVTLSVWTENSCFDLYKMENAVFVEPSGVVEFPNAFRPNSPLEENREFKPGIIDHVDDYHLMIFNRWGEMIFESFNQDIGWDGKYKGSPAKPNVYIWKVTGTYSDGRGFTKTGDVTLMY